MIAFGPISVLLLLSPDLSATCERSVRHPDVALQTSKGERFSWTEQNRRGSVTLTGCTGTRRCSSRSPKSASAAVTRTRPTAFTIGDREPPNRDFLRGLYGVVKDCDAHIRFVVLIGASKLACLFSGLNNLHRAEAGVFGHLRLRGGGAGPGLRPGIREPGSGKGSALVQWLQPARPGPCQVLAFAQAGIRFSQRPRRRAPRTTSASARSRFYFSEAQQTSSILRFSQYSAASCGLEFSFYLPSRHPSSPDPARIGVRNGGMTWNRRFRP